MLCLAAAALGAGVAAGQEAVPTAVEGATYQFGNTYAGAHSTEKWLDGGEVTASSSATGTAFANNIYLVGEGGEATVDDVRYTHTEDISTQRLYGATGNDLTHNAIDFYGTGIEVGRMDNADILNFHLTAETSDAVLALSLPLDLVDVTLNFAATALLAVGSSITLINSAAEIRLSDDQLARTYTITDGAPLTTARLSYTEGVGLSLHLAPEPTMPALTLPALLRRRRR